MKYLLTVFLLNLFIYASGQDVASDSIPVIYVDTFSSSLKIPDLYSNSCISNDSINYIDNKGLKQGIWIRSSRYIGNCTNSTATYYAYYENNKILMSYLIDSDNNACYPSQTNFLCTIYDENERGYCEMNNVKNKNSNNDYLWKSIYDPKRVKINGSTNHGYQFAKTFFEENMYKKRRKKMKFTYRGKRIPGDYHVL